jgi:AcrR family transcriptional regulator
MGRNTRQTAVATREAILDVSERLFIEHGVGAVSIEAIAASIGASRGAVYWHFRDKNDLLMALFIRAREALRFALQTLLAPRRAGGAARNVQRFCQNMLVGDTENGGRIHYASTLVSHGEIFLGNDLTAGLAAEAFSELHAALVRAIRRTQSLKRVSRSQHLVTADCAMALQALLLGYARMFTIGVRDGQPIDATSRFVRSALGAVSTDNPAFAGRRGGARRGRRVGNLRRRDTLHYNIARTIRSTY